MPTPKWTAPGSGGALDLRRWQADQGLLVSYWPLARNCLLDVFLVQVRPTDRADLLWTATRHKFDGISQPATQPQIRWRSLRGEPEQISECCGTYSIPYSLLAAS